MQCRSDNWGPCHKLHPEKGAGGRRKSVGHETITGNFLGLLKKFKNNVWPWNIFKFALDIYLYLTMYFTCSECYPIPNHLQWNFPSMPVLDSSHVFFLVDCIFFLLFAKIINVKNYLVYFCAYEPIVHIWKAMGSKRKLMPSYEFFSFNL